MTGAYHLHEGKGLSQNSSAPPARLRSSIATQRGNVWQCALMKSTEKLKKSNLREDVCDQALHQ